MTRKHFETAGLTTQEARDGRLPAAKRKTAKKKHDPRVKGRCVSRRGYHSLRHSFITECARAGVPMGQIRDWIGHSSTMITEIYAHWSPEQQHEQILQALPAISETPVVPAKPLPGPVPEWVREELAKMTPGNWREIRDRLCEGDG